MNLKIRKIEKPDQKWIEKFFTENWGSDFIVSRGKIHRPENLDGFICEEAGEIAGLVTVSIEDNGLEIISLNSLKSGKGIGSKLIEEVVKMAREKSLARVWLITTNDNLDALKFYQKKIFHLVRFILML
jgi:N-acetylglutamate synthase-like GNAT family acetyltransferase